MRITSPHWNESDEFCEKHMIPLLPCPSCLAGEGDEDLEFVVTDTDMLALEADPDLQLQDLAPANIKNPTFVKGYN